MEEDLIIRETTLNCKELFRRCLEISGLDEGDWLEQKSAEFNWWTSGLNADKIGPGSLDSRLRLRPDVVDVVVDLLEGLITALSKCEDIAWPESSPEDDSPESPVDRQDLATDELDRTPSPWSNMSDSTCSQARSLTEDDNDDQTAGDLYQEQRFYIQTNLEILIRIHAAIKKSGLKFRNKRADENLMRAEARYQLERARLGEHMALYGSDASIGEHERFRRFLTRRVLQNGYKEGLLRHIDSTIQQSITTDGSQTEDHPYVARQKALLVVFRAYLYDPARLTPIQNRLIKANVVRRNRLIHAGGVEKGQSRTQRDEPELLPKLPLVKGTTPKLNSQDQVLNHIKEIPAAPLSQALPTTETKSRKSFVSQAATGLASNFSITAAISSNKRTKSNATKMSARVAKMDYPKCPASQGPFPCPYCPSILSPEYTNKTKWRAHVAQDLCPYICIFEDCESPDDMYTSTYEWMLHMAKYHSTIEWVCIECSEYDLSGVGAPSTHSFDGPIDLKDHIASFHPRTDDSEMESLVHAGKRPAGIQKVSCPLCRPGFVSSAAFEEDEDPCLPDNYVQETGLEQLEEDEHIATHIHEFSLQAFPWPEGTKLEHEAGLSSSHSTVSSRQEIILKSKDDVDSVPEVATDLYNREEIFEILQCARQELGILLSVSTERRHSLGLDLEPRLEDIIDELQSEFERTDHDAFLIALNDYRITMYKLQELAVDHNAEPGQEKALYIDLVNHEHGMMSLLRDDRLLPPPNEIDGTGGLSLPHAAEDDYTSQGMISDPELNIGSREVDRNNPAPDLYNPSLQDIVKSKPVQKDDQGVTKWENSQRFVAIGIDFGTVYSGVSWARSTYPKEINAITGWSSKDHRNRHEVQVPTLYDIDSGGWGYEITPDMKPIKWLKLLLLNSEDIETADIRKAPQLQQARDTVLKSKNITALQAVGLYLRELWNHTYSVLFSIMDIENLPLRVAITIPAIWPAYAQHSMREAAKIAGIMKHRDIGETTMILVQEPEAAALATLSQRNNSPEIQKDESFVVCDAGGGTVDVISYKVVSEYPFMLEECVPGEGKLAGAFQIDQAFESYLRCEPKLKLNSLTDDEYNQFILGEWELGAKRSFSNADAREKYHLHPPSKAYGTLSRLRGKDTLIISREEMAGFFNRSLTGIRILVGKQFEEVMEATGRYPKKILLVGGLGSSEYVYDVLNEVFSNKVLRPSDGWSAISRGAVLRLMQENISSQPTKSALHELAVRSIPDVISRRSRYHYGIQVNVPITNIALEPEDIIITNPGGAQVVSRMRWYLSKGDRVEKKSRIQFKYHHYFTPENIPPRCVFDILYSAEDEAPKRFNSGVLNLCRIECDWDKPIAEWQAVGDPSKGWRKHDDLELTMELQGEPIWEVRVGSLKKEHKVSITYAN